MVDNKAFHIVKENYIMGEGAIRGVRIHRPLDKSSSYMLNNQPLNILAYYVKSITRK